MARKKKISVTELKALLEGMDLLQGTDWTPDPSQWKKIREKISQLEEVSYPPAPRQQPQQAQQPVDQGYPQQLPPRSASLGLPTEPMDSSMAPRVDYSTTAPLAPAGGKSKTPDIDTSDGSYKTSFE